MALSLWNREGVGPSKVRVAMLLLFWGPYIFPCLVPGLLSRVLLTSCLCIQAGLKFLDYGALKEKPVKKNKMIKLNIYHNLKVPKCCMCSYQLAVYAPF